jgi:DNA-binding transcriptional LysR family regulator
VLTIHQLEVFVTIAEQGSLRAAAEQLVVSQPAVSSTLAALERSVGVELVTRVGRGIELNEAGETLARYARLLLGMLDEAVTATRLAADPGSSQVAIGATTTAADYLLMPLLAQVRRRHPATAFTLEVGSLAQTWRLLTDHRVDLAVSSRPPALGSLESVATAANEFVLVAAPGVVWPGTLKQVTWLVREDGTSIRAISEELMALLGITPPTMTIGSNAAIQRSAEAGLGAAVLPSGAVRDAVAARSLSIVHTKATPLQKPWHILVRRGEALDQRTRDLVEHLVELDEGFALTAAGKQLLAPG